MFLLVFIFLVSFPEFFLDLFGFSLDNFTPQSNHSAALGFDALMTETLSAIFVASAEIYVAAYRVMVVVLDFWLVYLLAGVFFGIGLIDLAGQIKMARLTGVSMIVGSVLSIVGIGVLVLFFAMGGCSDMFFLKRISEAQRRRLVLNATGDHHQSRCDPLLWRHVPEPIPLGRSQRPTDCHDPRPLAR